MAMSDHMGMVPQIFSDMPALALDENGIIRQWNVSCANITGFSASEMLGTRDAWRAFWDNPRPVLADILLGRDYENLDKSLLRISPTCVVGIVRIGRELAGEKTVWTLGALLENPDGSVMGCCQVFHPVNLNECFFKSEIMQAFIEKFPVPVSICINGKFAMINRLNARLFGGEPADLIGQPVSELLDESDRERFLTLNANNYSHVKTGNTYRWKYRIRNKIRYIEGCPTVFKAGSQNVLISTVRDVTESELATRRLEQEHYRLLQENARLLAAKGDMGAVYLGTGKKMSRTFSHAMKMARTDSNLVILGETGTGKSFLARMIHGISPRREHPFVLVNCAAIPESLFESQFFGHVKGSFTGAEKNHEGFLSQANHGTLFLDEVGELTPTMQAKLLHALEQGKFTPLGGSTPQQTDVRILCATNRDIPAMLGAGTLREDFFYRIFVMYISLPPLRECKEDLPNLIQFFFRKLNPLEGEPEMPPGMMERFMEYDWPGNVRELQNCILRYLAIGEINFISTRVLAGGKDDKAKKPAPGLEPLEQTIAKVERECILRAIELNGNSKIRAAEVLGMNLRTFYRRCSKLGLDRDTMGNEK